MDKRFKWNMFITSFLPLWISIVIANISSIIVSAVEKWKMGEKFLFNIKVILNDNFISIIVTLVVVIVFLVTIWNINRFIKDKNKNPNKPKIKITNAKRANKLSSEFLLAYILPMIAFDFTNLKSIILFVIYFGMLAFLCIRNNNVYTNILLELKGYRMYSCDLEKQVMGKTRLYKECLVISKNNLIIQIDNDIEYWDFDNYIYIDLT